MTDQGKNLFMERLRGSDTFFEWAPSTIPSKALSVVDALGLERQDHLALTRLITHGSEMRDGQLHWLESHEPSDLIALLERLPALDEDSITSVRSAIGLNVYVCAALKFDPTDGPNVAVEFLEKWTVPLGNELTAQAMHAFAYRLSRWALSPTESESFGNAPTLVEIVKRGDAYIENPDDRLGEMADAWLVEVQARPTNPTAEPLHRGSRTRTSRPTTPPPTYGTALRGAFITGVIESGESGVNTPAWMGLNSNFVPLAHALGPRDAEGKRNVVAARELAPSLWPDDNPDIYTRRIDRFIFLMDWTEQDAQTRESFDSIRSLVFDPTLMNAPRSPEPNSAAQTAESGWDVP